MNVFLSGVRHPEYTSRAISHLYYSELVSSVKLCDSPSLLVLWVFHHYLTTQGLSFISLKHLHKFVKNVMPIFSRICVGNFFKKLHLAEMMYF